MIGEVEGGEADVAEFESICAAQESHALVGLDSGEHEHQQDAPTGPSSLYADQTLFPSHMTPHVFPELWDRNHTTLIQLSLSTIAPVPPFSQPPVPPHFSQSLCSSKFPTLNSTTNGFPMMGVIVVLYQ